MTGAIGSAIEAGCSTRCGPISLIGGSVCRRRHGGGLRQCRGRDNSRSSCLGHYVSILRGDNVVWLTANYCNNLSRITWDCLIYGRPPPVMAEVSCDRAPYQIYEPQIIITKSGHGQAMAMPPSPSCSCIRNLITYPTLTINP